MPFADGSPTQNEKFSQQQLLDMGKPKTEYELRHNYLARTEAARNEADKTGMPALEKMANNWKGVTDAEGTVGSC